jgi:hypothetical protein
VWRTIDRTGVEFAFERSRGTMLEDELERFEKAAALRPRCGDCGRAFVVTVSECDRCRGTAFRPLGDAGWTAALRCRSPTDRSLSAIIRRQRC